MSPEQAATVLTIEDDAGVRHGMAAFLEDRGYKILEADNGRVGLDVFRDQKPDLVLVDLRMPEINGLEVLATIHDEAPKVPVIIVSGTGVISNAVEALHLGAWDYVLKPIEDMEILSHAVEKALERARLIREERERQQHLEEAVRTRTAELETANKSLLHEVAERRRAEQQREELITELEARNAELERFTYTVSHDLKSPLITIKGFVGILEDDLAHEEQRDQVPHDLKRISAAADKMFHFLDDLLQLSRVGRLVHPSEEIVLRDLVQEAIGMVQGAITNNRVHIDVASDLPVVFGDRLRLREVFQNLIENAVKHMGDQPEPRVEIGTRLEADAVVCYVRDNGVGIEPRFHEKIFGLFDKLDPRSAGTGVGLALVKRIIEVYGGRIWVESEGKGRGATFCFTLPSEKEH